MPTGNLAAKLAAQGTDTDMDIFYDLDFSYAGLVEESESRYRPTAEGLLHADGMAAELFVL